MRGVGRAEKNGKRRVEKSRVEKGRVGREG